MKENQKEAIQREEHWDELNKSLVHSVDSFLLCLEKSRVITLPERQEIDKPTAIGPQKLMHSLNLIQSKDNGWETLIAHLRQSGRKELADKLCISAGEPLNARDIDIDANNIRSYSQFTFLSGMLEWLTIENLLNLLITLIIIYFLPLDSEHFSLLLFLGVVVAACLIFVCVSSATKLVKSRCFMHQFKCKLAKHYVTQYTNVPTLFGHHKRIEDVWVPLQIDDDTESLSTKRLGQGIGHAELLKRLEDPKSPYVALVKGHPGVGKTTLVMKIACDWAIRTTESGLVSSIISSCLSLQQAVLKFLWPLNYPTQFQLVLAVPLREVGPLESDDLLLMVANYCRELLNLSLSEKKELLNCLNQLGSELLICFDGLDEYSGIESPFKTIFAAPFQGSVGKRDKSQPKTFDYKLLITSRPYACDVINPNFRPLRFVISPLSEIYLNEFIENHCTTDEGKTIVREYIRTNADLVIPVPLILIFVCWLADQKIHIPTDLTKLYERIVYHMILRKIDELEFPAFDSPEWKQLAVIKSTAGLAFEGCKTKKFEFAQKLREKFGVTTESFTYGFLLYKFNFEKVKCYGEFLHQSIQEFFAALHGFSLVSTNVTDETVRNYVMNEILKRDSKFYRFFFGLCSDEEDFEKTLEWLNPDSSKVSNMDFYMTNFKQKLCDYYVSHYAHVPKLFESSKHINQVWVPLLIGDKTNNHRGTLDHYQMLECVAVTTTSSVTIVEGHPGAGKTTLLKKIAYDWATSRNRLFDVVLVVPLRSAKGANDFLQMAADFYAQCLEISSFETALVINWLHGLGHKLLICFDGLDEYENFNENPFKSFFAFSPRSFSYHLLFTSRPYAAEIINQNFLALRFMISPFDEAHLATFVQRYCETTQTRRTVMEYLKDHSNLVFKVPLILIFVCYLADMREDIPNNLTLLYEVFLGRMLKREIERNTLIVNIMADQWKESAVVKWTAQLAFEGCQTGKFEFPLSLYHGVTRDSFACGFLLNKFNFREERLNAEFPHRSVQEFFAALHCFHLSSTNDKAERNSVMEEILNNEDSQFGRFFFGLCSVERKKFEEMLDWLNPTFGDVLTMPINLFLSRLSKCLSDCSEAELFGERLAASLDQLENQIQKEREVGISWDGYFDLPLSNRRFQSGLNLNGTRPCWSISHVDQPRWSRLTCVYGNLHDLREKFDKIQILLWEYAGISELAGMNSSLHLLPEVSTLFISPSDLYGFEVNFHLQYETTTTTAPTAATTQLRHFCFRFHKEEIRDLKEKFKDQLDTDGLIIGEPHQTGEEKEISWVTVTVKKRFDRSHLLWMLIPLAIEILSFLADSNKYSSIFSSPAYLPSALRPSVPF